MYRIEDFCCCSKSDLKDSQPGPLYSAKMHENHLIRGLALFNSSRFFDAHEVLEDAWRESPQHGPLRRHLQGMVQLAVAFHHQSTGNHVGARSVLERAMRNLNGADSSFPDIDFERLRDEVTLWRQYLDHSESAGEKKFEGRNVRRHDVPNRSVPALPPALPKIMSRR